METTCKIDEQFGRLYFKRNCKKVLFYARGAWLDRLDLHPEII